jgi:hypothetical protein
MIKPTKPIPTPRFSRGKISKIRANTIGITTPVAQACITRPSNKNGKLGALAQRADPAANSSIPPINNLRVEKRPIK